MTHTTNWHVITGAPCSGKTTLIRSLEAAGHLVVHEAARAYIEEQLALGLDLDEMKKDLLHFEREILNRKIAAESTLNRDAEVFLDRAIPDSIAYYRFCNLAADEAVEASGLFRYRTVFFLDYVELETDAIRSEDRADIIGLEQLLWSCYRELGYHPIRM